MLTCCVTGQSSKEVSRSLDESVQAVNKALHTMLHKHTSLYTIDVVTALRELNRTKGLYCVLLLVILVQCI